MCLLFVSKFLHFIVNVIFHQRNAMEGTAIKVQKKFHYILFFFPLLQQFSLGKKTCQFYSFIGTFIFFYSYVYLADIIFRKIIYCILYFLFLVMYFFFLPEHPSRERHSQDIHQTRSPAMPRRAGLRFPLISPLPVQPPAKNPAPLTPWPCISSLNYSRC